METASFGSTRVARRLIDASVRSSKVALPRVREGTTLARKMSMVPAFLRFISVTSFAMTSFAMTLSCSSNDGGGRCGGFDACGGDVTGNWTVSSSCVEGNLKAAANLGQSLPPACRGNYDEVEAHVTGTVSFANGVAKNDTVTTVDYALRVSGACIAANGINTPDLSAACQAVGAAIVGKGYHQVVTCSVEGSGCSCAAKDVYRRDEELGYTISGNKLSYTGSDDSMDFCVDGPTLHARQFATELVSTVFFEATKAD
jgi:hypothetical protein